MQLIKKPFSIPKIIIKEGKIDVNELQKSGKDSTWVKNKLVILNVDAHDVLLATIDSSDDFKVYLYV